MPEMWYMDRKSKGIFYSGWDADKVYDGYKSYHVNTKSGKYGAVGWRVKWSVMRDAW